MLCRSIANLKEFFSLRFFKSKPGKAFDLRPADNNKISDTYEDLAGV